MKELKFKTNINCGGCIVSVTPVLDKIVGDGNWQVDITMPVKILTIKADDVDIQQLTAELQAVGYSATLIDPA